jgi:hypothetical protein
VIGSGVSRVCCSAADLQRAVMIACEKTGPIDTLTLLLKIVESVSEDIWARLKSKFGNEGGE